MMSSSECSATQDSRAVSFDIFRPLPSEAVLRRKFKSLERLRQEPSFKRLLDTDRGKALVKRLSAP